MRRLSRAGQLIKWVASKSIGKCKCRVTGVRSLCMNHYQVDCFPKEVKKCPYIKPTDSDFAATISKTGFITGMFNNRMVTPTFGVNRYEAR